MKHELGKTLIEGLEEKAKESCQKAGYEASGHFADVSKMIGIGKELPFGGTRRRCVFANEVKQSQVRNQL